MSWEIFIPTALVAMVGVGVTLVLAARRSPYVRPWALLAAIALAAMPVAIVMHNLVSAIFGVEEAVFFIAALVIAPVGFALGTLGSGITLVQKGSRAIGASLVLGGAGMALFGLYSLVALVREARPLLHPGASVISLTYYGAEKVVAHYNLMGVAKAALEASTRYLAADLGPSGIRVTAISAGPIRTLAASGIAGFRKLYGTFAEVAPLRSNITIDDVGGTAVWLASDLSRHVTGEIVHVDGGFSILGVPTVEEGGLDA